jgi:hypothetical protein
MLKCRVFGDKTGPSPGGQVFRVVSPVTTVWSWMDPQPEMTREFGPVANTTQHEGISCITFVFLTLTRTVASYYGM